MKKYRIYRKYENSSNIIFDEIEAENFEEAKIKCKEILIENLKNQLILEKRNIYTSKLIECELLKFKGFFLNTHKE